MRESFSSQNLGSPRAARALQTDELTSRQAWFAVEDDRGERFRVFGVAPGDRLLIAPRPTDPPWADLVEVLDAGPQRRNPPCSVFGTCGGCHWLHLTDEGQRERRRRMIELAFESHGMDAAQLAFEPMEAALAYRHRVRLQIDGRTTPPRIGFHRQSARDVIDVKRCPLLTPELAASVDEFRSLARQEPDLFSEMTGVEITVIDERSGAGLLLNPRDRPPSTWPDLGEVLIESMPSCVGVAVTGGSRSSVGERFLAGLTPAGQPVRCAVGGFLQTHLAAADRLAALVQSFALDRPVSSIVELFAGSGLLTWNLARSGAVVHAIEEDARCVAAGRSLFEAEAGSHVRWIQSDARQLNPEDLACDLLVADPPRNGLGGDLVETLALARPRHIVLVSCSIDSAAHDLSLLVAAGYELATVRSLEMFPHTRHVELVSLMNASRE